MDSNSSENINSSYNKLRVLYYVAVATIALLIVFSGVIIQSFLSGQKGDSNVINIAGRQRMLSQKIVKELLLINSVDIGNTYILEKDLEEWNSRHQDLKRDVYGFKFTSKKSKNELVSLFDSVSPIQNRIYNFTNSVNGGHVLSTDDLKSLLEDEKIFLSLMNEIVFKYDKESSSKIKKIVKYEYALLFVALLLLLAEIIWIFTPLLKAVRSSFDKLIYSREELLDKNEKLNNKNEELVLSSKRMSALNEMLDSSTLFARADTKGRIIQISNNLSSLLGSTGDEIIGLPISEVINNPKYGNYFMGALLRYLASNKVWESEVQFGVKGGGFVWLDMTIVPVSSTPGILSELFFICTNVTEKKTTELELSAQKEDEHKQELQEQKYRSVQILEAQEEERKRLAREMHDGVGQYLTALKFNVSAIDFNRMTEEQLETRFTSLKNLLGETIKEVRRVSFNLTPNELSDYGIAAALKNFAIEMDKVTDLKVHFNNVSDYSDRLDLKIERNAYRIVQEAVNNALKYSKANNIHIILNHDAEKLTVTIHDDGVGFNSEEVLTEDIFKISGHGLFNMKERASFINANFEVKTGVNKGTKIIFEISLT